MRQKMEYTTIYAPASQQVPTTSKHVAIMNSPFARAAERFRHNLLPQQFVSYCDYAVIFGLGNRMV